MLKASVLAVNIEYDNVAVGVVCGFLNNLCDRFGLTTAGIADNAGMALVEFITVKVRWHVISGIPGNLKSSTVLDRKSVV